MENKEELKVILKEELAVSADKLKEKGIVLVKEALEDVALEMSDLTARVSVRTSNKIDDTYQIIRPLLDKELDKIDGKSDL